MKRFYFSSDEIDLKLRTKVLFFTGINQLTQDLTLSLPPLGPLPQPSHLTVTAQLFIDFRPIGPEMAVPPAIHTSERALWDWWIKFPIRLSDLPK
jgi:hypothetical protein